MWTIKQKESEFKEHTKRGLSFIEAAVAIGYARSNALNLAESYASKCIEIDKRDKYFYLELIPVLLEGKSHHSSHGFKYVAGMFKRTPEDNLTLGIFENIRGKWHMTPGQWLVETLLYEMPLSRKTLSIDAGQGWEVSSDRMDTIRSYMARNYEHRDAATPRSPKTNKPRVHSSYTVLQMDVTELANLLCESEYFLYQMTEDELGWLEFVKGRYAIADYIWENMDAANIVKLSAYDFSKVLDDDCGGAGKAVCLSDDTALQRIFFCGYQDPEVSETD